MNLNLIVHRLGRALSSHSNVAFARKSLMAIALYSLPVCALTPLYADTPPSGQAGFILLPSGDPSGDQAAMKAVHDLTTGEMTADKAVQTALMNNMDLQARLADLNIASGDLVQAGLLKNPVFDLLYRKSNAPDTVANIEYSVAMDFLSILYLPMRKNIARAKYEQTRLEVTNDVLALAYDVRADFYKLAQSSENLTILKESVKGYKASYEAAKKLHKAGNTADLDMHREQAQYEETKIMLAEAEAEAVSRREDLNLKMGLWGAAAANWKAPEALPTLPKLKYSGEGMESVAVYQRLDLAAARQKLLVSAQELGFGRAKGWLPELNIGYDAERETDDSWLRGVEINFPVPLFDHGQGTTLKNRGKMLKACSEYYAMAVKVRQEVRLARAQMFSARERVRYYNKIMMPLKTRIREESLLMYNGMAISVFELLAAKRDELKTRREKIMALKDYWVARSNLEKAMGGSLNPHTMEYNGTSNAGVRQTPYAGHGKISAGVSVK